MSMLPAKFNIAIAACVALVQLAVLPATYVLHIGCEHEDCSISANADQCGHGRCCPFHHHEAPGKHPPKKGERRHDSDECRVCQTAFASIIASPKVACLTCHELLTIISQRSAVITDSVELACHPGRGPPAC